MRFNLRNVFFGLLALLGSAFAAAPAWAVYCPVTPASILTELKNEPAALYHSAQNRAAVDEQCGSAVAEARRRGWQLPTLPQYQALVANCGSNCSYWSGYRSLAYNPVVHPRPHQPRRVVHRPQPRPVVIHPAPRRDVGCYSCVDQHGRRFLVTPEGVAHPVADPRRHY
ncbi:MAG: hypothetical protein INF43_00480 [Alphaproteobacteria bacterium]|nr:hypothetical protein [Alphaproteobacteria bacterium]